MFKLALNAGHGLNTPGKRCLKSIDPNETREWVLNSRICNKIQEKLSEYSGIEILRLDDITGQTDVALKTRTNKANAFGADFYLAIHHNAGVGGGKGGGVISIVYKSIADGSVTNQWQKELYNAVIARTGLKGNRSVPLQKQDLHEVRESNMPAVLLECGFMDSTTDTPIILTEEFAENAAAACAEVIAARAGLKKKNEIKGFLDTASAGGISGWVWDKSDRTIEVHLYIYRKSDGAQVFKADGIIADIYRVDLMEAGVGSGKHGYVYERDLYTDIGAGEYIARVYAITEDGSNPCFAEKEFTIEQRTEPQVPSVEEKPSDEEPTVPAVPENEPTESLPDKGEDTEKDEKPKTGGILEALRALLKLILNWIKR